VPNITKRENWLSPEMASKGSLLKKRKIRRLKKSFMRLGKSETSQKKLWPSSPKNRRFIREHADRFSVTKMCQVLKVSRSLVLPVDQIS